MELSATNKSREETLANALLAYNPSWEETEEGMVLVVVDGWEMFLKEKGSKGQRLLNEVDPEKVALAYNYVPKGESNASAAADQRMVEFVNAELPGAPEDIQAHEITEFEVDAETAPLLMSLTGKPSRDQGRHWRPSHTRALNGINDRGDGWSYHHEALYDVNDDEAQKPSERESAVHGRALTGRPSWSG